MAKLQTIVGGQRKLLRDGTIVQLSPRRSCQVPSLQTCLGAVDTAAFIGMNATMCLAEPTCLPPCQKTFGEYSSGRPTPRGPLWLHRIVTYPRAPCHAIQFGQLCPWSAVLSRINERGSIPLPGVPSVVGRCHQHHTTFPVLGLCFSRERWALTAKVLVPIAPPQR